MNHERLAKITEKLPAFLKKYAPVIGVGLLGLLLLVWPTKRTQDASEKAVGAQVVSDGLHETEQRLEAVLSCIDGAGQVRVMLSYRTGEQTYYQTDETYTKDETGSTQESVTVFAASSGAQKTPLVVKTDYPVYQGALVVCTGADRAAVQLAIVDAVRSLTGLGSDKITVVKMKCQ